MGKGLRALVAAACVAALAAVGWWAWSAWSEGRAAAQLAREAAEREQRAEAANERFECQVTISAWNANRRDTLVATYGDQAETVVDDCRSLLLRSQE